MNITRAKFLKNGLGLASVLACNKAPAIVRSLLGGRYSGAIDTDADSTAKLYVQDGLIAMWDGIENAGCGVHDENTTQWIDLIGGRAFNLTGTYEWLEDSIVINNAISAPYSAEDKEMLANGYADEIVVLGQPTLPSATFGGCFGIGDNLFYYGAAAKYQLWYSRNSRYVSTTYAYPNLINKSFSFDLFSDGSTMTYFSGAKFAQIGNTTPPTGSRGFTFNVYGNYPCKNFRIACRRVYCRPLTDEEVAHNYSIDKIRFGL